MLNIDIEKNGDVAIVRCSGRLVGGEAVSSLRNAVLSGKDARMFLLDLAEVRALDAGGVNALVALHQWAGNRGMKVKLVNPSSFVREMMVRFRLDRVLEISSLRDALVVLSGRACPELATAVC
jgi:anti-anti-sigma factor